MAHKFTTVRMWVETKRFFRLIAAITGEKLVEVMHRLAVEELQRLRQAQDRWAVDARDLPY